MSVDLVQNVQPPFCLTQRSQCPKSLRSFRNSLNKIFASDRPRKILRNKRRSIGFSDPSYRDAEAEYVDLIPEEDNAMPGIIGASITYRLAFGPNAGRTALTLQAVPAIDKRKKSNELVSKQAGFSMHAGVACKSNQREKLERLCRYITIPAITEQRLSLASNGNVIVALKTLYDDGTSYVVRRRPP